jgi:phosphoribosyl 1,2-cyclic phosphodiesterase
MIHIAQPPTVKSSPTASPDSLIQQISVTFWGVRGSVPTPTIANQRYGGNTVCTEALIGNHRIIFDSGTGIVGLGHQLQQRHSSEAHIFFTHSQWDRIQGFPFFQPAFNPENHFSIYGGTAPNGASIKHCLTDQMLQPHFAMPLQNMSADLAFHTLSDRARFYIDDILVETLQINPLTEALGYRLTWQDRSLVYATDTPAGLASEAFLQFVYEADLLIYDGTYADLSYLRTQRDETPLEVTKSIVQPWDLGIKIAQKAQVKELVLLHHSPVQDDNMLDLLQQQLSDHTPSTKIAHEGMILHL